MKKVLNLGCGSTPFKSNRYCEFTNIDCLLLTDLDGIDYIQQDLLNIPYPIVNAIFDEIWMFHVIEHILERDHDKIIMEMLRLLKPDGRICFTYPEFLKCSENYRTDRDGRRDYWKACIYGRGWSLEDSHRALMDTPFFIKHLNTFALDVVKVKPEPKEPWNTILVCKRGQQRLSYEEILGKEFGSKLPIKRQRISIKDGMEGNND